MELIKPTNQAIEKVCEYKENNRPSPLFDHLTTVREGISALGWITVEQLPAPFVEGHRDSSRFFANRVITNYKIT